MALRIGSARLRATFLFFLGLAGALIASAQSAPPMNLETLKKVLAIGEDVLSTNDVIQRVKKEGVDFFLDADMKTELILAAAEGRRSETDTLKIIDSLADSCIPCKERMEAPISAELALRFLKEKVRSKDILREIKKRGLAPGPITQGDIVALRAAGASEPMLRVMKPDARPLIPDGFSTIEPQKAKDFNPNAPYGQFDVRARVDETVEFQVVSDLILYKALAGAAPVNQASESTGILPRVPADAITFSWRQRDGRSKVTSVDVTAPDSFGYQGFKFVVNDEKGKDDRYHIEITWQLKPYTLETLTPEVEELGDSFPELLVTDIRRRGYGSALQPEAEQALRQAGATNEVISTIRGSIRPANTPPR